MELEGNLAGVYFQLSESNKKYLLKILDEEKVSDGLSIGTLPFVRRHDASSILSKRIVSSQNKEQVSRRNKLLAAITYEDCNSEECSFWMIMSDRKVKQWAGNRNYYDNLNVEIPLRIGAVRPITQDELVKPSRCTRALIQRIRESTNDGHVWKITCPKDIKTQTVKYLLKMFGLKD